MSDKVDSLSLSSQNSSKPSNIKGATQEQIDDVKRRFLLDVEENRELYDECDVEKIKQNDFYTRRYMNYQNQGVEKGFEHMKKAYRWRKSFGINRYDPLIVPREIYQLGALFTYPPDRDGSAVLYLRGKMHRKIEITVERIKQLLAHNLNKLDEAVGREYGWNIVLDARETGYSNADFNMLIFLFETCKTAFPDGIKYFIVFGLPWVLNAFATFILQFLPSHSKRKIKFWDQQQLEALIHPDNLPDFLGGNCKECYRRVPKGARGVHDIADTDYGLTADEVERLLRPSLKYIDTVNFVEVDLNTV